MPKKVEMEKVRLTFNVKLDFNLDSEFSSVFLVGNTKELGLWNPEKALELKRKGDIFTKMKTFEKNQVLEYKILLQKTYDKVELDENFAELENRTEVCDKAKTINLIVKNFKI